MIQRSRSRHDPENYLFVLMCEIDRNLAEQTALYGDTYSGQRLICSGWSGARN
jgi:hypothetical protein